MKRFLTILSVLALALSVSCVTETELEPVSSDETLVTFTMQLPYTNGEAATRAITPTPGEENQISSVTVWALIQRGGVWVYNYAATNISQAISGNDMVITATVRELSSAQQFVIITNSATEVAAAAPYLYEPYTAVEDRLVTATGGGEWPARLNGTGAFSPIPMYARTDAQVVSASSNNSIGPYQLLRMVARINVTLASSILGSNFTLEEATLFNYKTAGYITHGKSGFSVNKVTAPAVPTSGDHTGTLILQPTAIYQSDKSTDTRGTILNSIYTFESPAIVSESAKQTGTALVVGGYYNGSPTMSYYRIDLKTSDDVSSNISSGILRNHSYNVEIQSVTGSGYGSEIDAYKGANQLSAKVVAWNDAVQHTIFDGTYFLTVSEDELSYSASNGQLNIETETNYNHGDRGYPAGVQANASEVVYGSGSGWISFVDVTGTNGSLTRTIGIVAAPNTTGSVRTAKVYIKAGNMSKVIHVTQNPAWIRITESGSAVSAMEFRSKRTLIGVDPTVRTLTIEWEPSDQPLTIGKSTAVGANAFVWQDAANGLAALPANSSPYTFTIDPAGITQLEVDGDPFIEKETLLSFSVFGMTELLNLKQIHYNLVAEGFLGGYAAVVTRTGTVKTNAPWSVHLTDVNGIIGSHSPTSGVADPDGVAFVYSFNGGITVFDPTFRFSSVGDYFDYVDVTVDCGAVAPYFARSNIVWTGSKLTFAVTETDNLTIPANVQGVFFAWGSLAAENPAGAFYNNSLLYAPSGNISVGRSSIPRISSSTQLPYYVRDGITDLFSYYNDGQGYDPDTDLGDICRYISDMGWVEGNWRMATRQEFAVLSVEGDSPRYLSNGAWTDINNSTAGLSNAYGPYDHGFYQVESGAWFGTGVAGKTSDSETSPSTSIVYLPASGWRSSGGYHYFLQSGGTYYSSSGYSTGFAAGTMEMDGTYFVPSHTNPTNNYAYPVRCIQR